MTLYQIICLILQFACLIGVPALTSKNFEKKHEAIADKCKAQQDETTAVKLGIQALLRDRLYEKYDKYEERGWAPIYAHEDWENMYKQYHALGANGVMDSLNDKFMKLPTESAEGGTDE